MSYVTLLLNSSEIVCQFLWILCLYMVGQVGILLGDKGSTLEYLFIWAYLKNGSGIKKF